MSIYLHDIPLSQARNRLTEALMKAGLWKVLGQEEIKLDQNAVGRVLTASILAKISSPHYHASAMDGFAVVSSDTNGASLTSPVTIPSPQKTIYIDTGDPLPEWANAVIPIEDIEPLNISGMPHENPRQPELVRVRASVPPWKNVRPMGEDMVATQLVLPAGHVLRPVDLGAIAGSGHYSIKVSRKPRVAIVPTGTELKPIGEPVKSGDIIEYNSLVLAGQILEWGGEATCLPIVEDDKERIKQQVEEAARTHDLVLLNAGSSAGSEDFSAKVIEELGTLLVHGVAVRPGHPVILGMVNVSVDEKTVKSTPIVGIPGYPVSAALTGEIFVEPLIAIWLGRPPVEPDTIRAKLTRKVVSPGGDDDYIRVAVGKINDDYMAAPLTRGAGVITSLVKADGILIIPRGSQGLMPGADISVRLYRTRSEIEKTILAIGSHDMSLDILAQHLSLEGLRLASANVGSLGGLVALRRGEAHFSGSHLLDMETGEYNTSFIRQYLPDRKITLVNLVGREQGLIINKGNPKNISTINDLVRPDVHFINRQRGAGTRLLLDYLLKILGILPDSINGYSHEEFTHLSVAAAIASGRGNCGLGIAAAAAALELDFIPLYNERYDLVIPTEFIDSQLLTPVLDVINSSIFRNAVNEMPGYDTKRMGDVIYQF